VSITGENAQMLYNVMRIKEDTLKNGTEKQGKYVNCRKTEKEFVCTVFLRLFPMSQRRGESDLFRYTYDPKMDDGVPALEKSYKKVGLELYAHNPYGFPANISFDGKDAKKIFDLIEEPLYPGPVKTKGMLGYGVTLDMQSMTYRCQIYFDFTDGGDVRSYN
jgi:hypothetical protein